MKIKSIIKSLGEHFGLVSKRQELGKPQGEGQPCLSLGLLGWLARQGLLSFLTLRACCFCSSTSYLRVS